MKMAAKERKERKDDSAAQPPEKSTVISTGAKAEKWAERSGETSYFSSRGRRRCGASAHSCSAPPPPAEVRDFSTTLRPLFRLRSGRNDSVGLRLRRTASFFYFALLAFLCGHPPAAADEPFFKKGDVIALVGGEDMVAMSEYGYLELLLTRALPEHRLKFRNLAWEGDTVFEQRRDLNFPPLEAQLEQVGATVVLCQFGQMESLAGKEKLPEFVAAYEKLIARMSGGGKRRIVVVSSTRPETKEPAHLGDANGYSAAARDLAKKKGVEFLDLFTKVRDGHESEALTHDAIHLNAVGLWLAARHMMIELAIIGVSANPARTIAEKERELTGPYPNPLFGIGGVGRASEKGDLTPDEFETFRQLIRAKNRLWFDYWRVQNWAFLAGDRTEQPSSRDHVDRTKRWFPAEREQFLPLIDAKEQEIWTLAAKLAQP